MTAWCTAGSREKHGDGPRGAVLWTGIGSNLRKHRHSRKALDNLAAPASEANGQLHPHRQLELSLQTVRRPCALMMMQIPVVLLQGNGVGLAASLGIPTPRPSNSRQRNCLPISVFCFRGSRQRNRLQSTSLPCLQQSSSHAPRLVSPRLLSARPCPFRLGASGPRGLDELDNSILPTRRQTHTLYLHAGMWGTALFCRACIRHVGKSSIPAAAIRRSSSIAALGGYHHEAPAGCSPCSSGLILLRRRAW